MSHQFIPFPHCTPSANAEMASSRTVRARALTSMNVPPMRTFATKVPRASMIWAAMRAAATTASMATAIRAHPLRPRARSTSQRPPPRKSCRPPCHRRPSPAWRPKSICATSARRTRTARTACAFARMAGMATASNAPTIARTNHSGMMVAASRSSTMTWNVSESRERSKKNMRICDLFEWRLCVCFS